MLKATQVYNIFSDVAARMMIRQSINIFHTIFLQVLTLSQHLLLKESCRNNYFRKLFEVW